MQKWNPRFERGRVRDEREVVRFLHRVRAEHRPTRLPRRHHVLMVAENGQSLRRERASSDVKNRRRQFAGNFVHVGNHQQQPLRSREGGRQRTRLQRTVNRARRAAFALHFDDGRNGVPEILHAASRPLIGPFTHR